MRFGLCVRLGVDLHVRLIEEGRRTHPAPTSGETQKWEGGMEEPVWGKGHRRREDGIEDVLGTRGSREKTKPI